MEQSLHILHALHTHIVDIYCHVFGEEWIFKSVSERTLNFMGFMVMNTYA